MKSSLTWFGICLGCVAVCGCGGGETAPKSTATETESPSQSAPAAQEKPLPTASIAAVPPTQQTPLDGLEFEGGEMLEDDPVEVLEPLEGSPEWYLREITRLQVQPLPKTEDVEELRKVRRERNDQVIDLASKVIQKTHRDPEKTRLFDVAVHHMLEARLQLALQGDRESVDILYDDAASLWERDRESKAAADGAFTLLTLAYTNARNTSGKDSKWLEEFARQANHFAANFPKEERRSLPMLFAAARTSELHELTETAIASYKQIQTLFPQSPQAQRVTGILRRLQMVGQPLELGGPLLSGDFLSMEQLQGRIVILSFWSSAAKASQTDLPIIAAFETKYGKYGLKTVGVCLDTDPSEARRFLDEQKITWPQIFHTEADKQGWNNPIVNYYGVLEVGHWLIDQDGKVVTTTLKADDLQTPIFPLLKRGARREAALPPR